MHDEMKALKVIRAQNAFDGFKATSSSFVVTLTGPNCVA